MGTNTVNLLNDAAATCGLTDYTFCDEFVGILNDILDEMEVNGCADGTVTALMYYDDCRQVYARHFEDLDEYTRNTEFNLDDPRHPRYFNVVQAAFELFCSQIKYAIRKIRQS